MDVPARVAGGGVSGRLIPYCDPECECLLVTHFEGRIRGDTIEGTFTRTHVEDSEIQTGVWKVTRKRP